MDGPEARDRVVELEDVPQPSIGAPLPVVVADESLLQLAYYAEDSNPDWDGTSVRVVALSTDDPVVLVRFAGAHAWFQGPPNDEAFVGHSLASHGLRPHAAFRIDNSSWLRRLEQMNSMHEHHDSDAFARLHHYIFAFHDSTFECVALSFTTVEVKGPLARVAQEMARTLDRR